MCIYAYIYYIEIQYIHNTYIYAHTHTHTHTHTTQDLDGLDLAPLRHRLSQDLLLGHKAKIFDKQRRTRLPSGSHPLCLCCLN